MRGVFTTCTVMCWSGARTGTIHTLRRQRATRATRTAATSESPAGAAGTTAPRAVAPRTGAGIRRTLGTPTLASAQFWPVQLQASKRSAPIGVRQYSHAVTIAAFTFGDTARQHIRREWTFCVSPSAEIPIFFHSHTANAHPTVSPHSKSTASLCWALS